jgi:NADP-dependent 3-hydroxy acid dehydrogenase YdfG
MVGKLDGKVAIVTGASSGIGEATALALAAEGARVAAVARRADRLETLTQRIAESGGQAIPLVADLT